LPGISEKYGTAISYESSRGCWWGEKHQCVFCGLNGETIGYRHKSAQKVFSDLKALREKYPGQTIFMTDNAMPSEYFNSLIPRLVKELPNSNLFYEVRPNLSLKDVAALKRAGVNIIQPGIESLSTSSLKLMRKGVTSRQNLALLRYGASVGLRIIWNLMIDIPGEQLDELERQLSLIPLLRHLQPPYYFQIIIQRFSPYFVNPEEYGLSNIRPWDSYFAVFPEGSDVEDIAYHFKADYRSASRDHPDIIKRFEKEIEIWRNFWRSDCVPPQLMVIRKGAGKFVLLDTRGLSGAEPISIISRDEAKVVLSDVDLNRGDKLLEWAIDRKLVAELDSAFVPLATGSPDLILEFEEDEKPAELC
jgi:ribosomal peptide maturation radical SAM protein 1